MVMETAEPGPVIPQWPGASAQTITPNSPTFGSMTGTTEAAVGEGMPNGTYTGQRLQYDRTPEQPFDPIGNGRILIQMSRQALLYLVCYMFGAFFSLIFFAIVALATRSFGPFELFGIFALIFALAAGCLYWLMPLPALLSEWRFSIDDKASAEQAIFEHIIWALQRRQTPLESVQVRRLRLAGEGTRDYLEIRRKIFAGYIGCFAFGQDLHVSWTLWVRVSPLRYVCMIIARIWQSLIARGTDIYVTLRYDSAKAMREAMHNATREGVDVAVAQLPTQGHGIIGSSVLATDLSL